MVGVTFWSLSKKSNSTKRPTGTGTTYNCNLKDNTSVLSPQIELDLGRNANPSSFNICYIPDFGRYYFCSWTYDHGRWLADCEVDTLATYKPQIGSSELYVLRSSHSYDWDIIDNLYPARNGQTESINFIDSDPWGTESLVLGVIGKSASSASMGSVQYYAMTPTQASSLFTYLLGDYKNPGTDTFSNLVWGGLELVDEAIKAEYNPLQYIASAMWFPFNVTTLSTMSATMKFGKWDILQNCYPLGATPVFSLPEAHILFPKHPDRDEWGAYLNGSPFASYILDYQPFGRIPLDGNICKDCYRLRTNLHVDLITGQGCLELTAQKRTVTNNEESYENKFLGTYWGNVGCEVKIGGVNQNILEAVISAVPGVLTGIAAESNITVAGSIGNGLLSAIPSPQVSGSFGSTLYSYLKTPSIEGKFSQMLSERNDDHAGRPLCKNKVISTIPGYIKASDGEIDLNATQAERETVAQFLTNGFFYE